MTPQPSPLVSTEWLQDERHKPDLKIVDAPFYMPGDPRTPEGEYAKTRIPESVLFDLDKIADRSSCLPHMLAAPDVFAQAVGRLGIGNGDRVVVYDHVGLLSAARVWWNFRVMGHDQVFVLDGGLPRWVAEGRPVQSGLPEKRVEPQTFTARFQPELLRSMDQVKDALARHEQVLDARSAGRFSAAEPEPRPGLPSGHIPGSRNLPHGAIVADGALVAPKILEGLFAAAGVDVNAPIIATCGSGVSAAILALALARLGHWETPIYDGSWTEWAGRNGADIAAGPA